MKVVSVINYKGGVGKTTLTANLGAYAASKNRRVLLIDIDPQTHLTFNFVSIEDWKKQYSESKTMRDFFQPVIDGENNPKSLQGIIIPIQNEDYTLDLISSHLDLIDTEMELVSMINVITAKQYASTSLRSLSYIRKALQKIQDDYDLVLIDCPPSFSIMVKNAIIASDYYIVPTKLDYLSMLGIDNLSRSVRKLLEEYEKHRNELKNSEYEPLYLVNLGVVPTMVNYFKGNELISTNEEYRKELDKKCYHIFKAIRNNSSVFGVAPKVGLPVVLTKPKLFFQKSQKIIVDELQELGEEFLEMVKL